MSLSDTEAQKFWPIYNHYPKDLRAVNNQKYELLKHGGWFESFRRQDFRNS